MSAAWKRNYASGLQPVKIESHKAAVQSVCLYAFSLIFNFCLGSFFLFILGRFFGYEIILEGFGFALV